MSSPGETPDQMGQRLGREIRPVMHDAGYEEILVGGTKTTYGRVRRPILPPYPAVWAAVALLLYLGRAFNAVFLLIVVFVMIVAFRLIFRRQQQQATITFEVDEGGACMRVSGKDNRLKARLIEAGAEDVTPSAS